METCFDTTLGKANLCYRVLRHTFGDREGYTITVREECGGKILRCELPDVTDEYDEARRIAAFLCQNAVSAVSVYDVWVERFCSP